MIYIHFYRTFRINNNKLLWTLLVVPILVSLVGVLFYCKRRNTVRRRKGMYQGHCFYILDLSIKIYKPRGEKDIDPLTLM